MPASIRKTTGKPYLSPGSLEALVPGSLWTALQEAEKSVSKPLCRCECGIERRVLAKSLKTGHSLSCGSGVAHPHLKRGLVLTTGSWKCQTCGSTDIGFRPAYNYKKSVTYAATSAYCNSSPSCRTAHLRGFTLTEYKELLTKGCAVCGTTEGRLEVDHDHAICSHSRGRSCKKCFRGILCTYHNTLVGKLEDPAAIKALTFLVNTSSSSELMQFLKKLL
jgi:hypothetical protein